MQIAVDRSQFTIVTGSIIGKILKVLHVLKLHVFVEKPFKRVQGLILDLQNYGETALN